MRRIAMWTIVGCTLVGYLVGCSGDTPSPPMDETAKNGSAGVTRTSKSRGPTEAEEEFCDMILRGEIQKVKEALKTDPTLLKAQDDARETPLHLAAKGGHLPLVAFFVEQGGDVNGLMRYDMTPLHLAAANGHKDVVVFLLDRGAKTDSSEWSEETPLHVAAESGHKAIVALLLDRGADIDAKDESGDPAISSAASQGNLEIYQLLVARGAKVDVGTNDRGWSILHSACIGGNVQIVKDLIDRGADVNAVSTNLDGVQTSPLSLSRGFGNTGAAEVLRKHGATVE